MYSASLLSTFYMIYLQCFLHVHPVLYHLLLTKYTIILIIMFYIMAQYIISLWSIRVCNFSGSWKYTTFLIAHTYNRVNFIIPVINIVFYSCNVWLYCSKPFLNHISIWTNVTSTPLKLCIQLPSGVVDPLSPYQTQRYNRLSNLLMTLLMFIYLYTSLITITHALPNLHRPIIFT